LLELVDQLRDGLFADAEPPRQLGQPRAAEVDVREQAGVGRPQPRRPGHRLQPRHGPLVEQARGLEQQLGDARRLGRRDLPRVVRLLRGPTHLLMVTSRLNFVKHA
jgi:hypothetical protein